MNDTQNKDSYIIGIFSKYNFRFLLADCSNSVSEAVKRHNFRDSSLVLAAKAMIGSFFLAGMVKEEMIVSIQLEGNGEIERVIGYSNRTGQMRSLVKNTSVKADPSDMTLGIGTGVFRVTRWGGVKKLHQSLTRLEKKSFEGNLLDHIQESDQVTAFLAIHVEALGDKVRAAGMILHALPGTEEELIEELFDKFDKIEYDTRELFSGGTKDALEKIENVLEVRSEILEEGIPEFYCGCNLEKIKDVILSLGKEESFAILEEHGFVELTCEFCKKPYKLDPEEVKLLFL